MTIQNQNEMTDAEQLAAAVDRLNECRQLAQQLRLGVKRRGEYLANARLARLAAEAARADNETELASRAEAEEEELRGKARTVAQFAQAIYSRRPGEARDISKRVTEIVEGDTEANDWDTGMFDWHALCAVALAADAWLLDAAEAIADIARNEIE